MRMKQNPHDSAFSSRPTCHDKLNLQLVLVDHYDSYTYNLYDMLASICVSPPVVLAKDADWHEFLREQRRMNSNWTMDGIILSPGPGTPTCDTDMGMSLQLIQNYSTTPILGVCLGHQAMGHVYGNDGCIQLAPCGPVHGQVRSVEIDAGRPHHSSGDLWKNVSNPLQVVRYHSLVVDWTNTSTSANEASLIPTAWAYDEKHPDSSTNAARTPVLMGLQHARYPHYGVQFHPESIGTQDGMQLLRNFCEICDQHKSETTTTTTTTTRESSHGTVRRRTPNTTGTSPVADHSNPPVSRHVLIHKVDFSSKNVPSTEQVFSKLFGSESHAVWLDSSSADQSKMDMARCSIMAAKQDGPLSRLVEYYGREFSATERKLRIVDQVGCEDIRRDTDILSYLRDELALQTQVMLVDEDLAGSHTVLTDGGEPADLPFEYRGGFLGYLGYEVRHDTLLELEREEQGHMHDGMEDSWVSDLADTRVPTAAFLFADQSLVYDHWKKDWYLVGVCESDAEDSILAWMKGVSYGLQRMADEHVMPERPGAFHYGIRTTKASRPLSFIPNRDRATYETDITTCHDQIRRGESYELCLTNQLEANVPVGDRTLLDLYRILRRRNPAPFASFLSFKGDQTEAGGGASVSICCSSPERFVSTKNRRPNWPFQYSDRQRLYVEAKPIKGTCARLVAPRDRSFTLAERIEDRLLAAELRNSIKNRAENLMIVDLLRNDLSRVCETGSVHVPKLMHIESYATVHQMVSTIRGTLNKRTHSAIDVLKACFPGGSMTGAPKLRTMDILHGIEDSVPRGPYSGSLGYISLNSSMDMNIVIRTAVVTKESDEGESYRIRVGAGGAITDLSESSDEYEEMLLKSRAVTEAVQSWADDSLWLPRDPVVRNGRLLDTRRLSNMRETAVANRNWTAVIAD